MRLLTYQARHFFCGGQSEWLRTRSGSNRSCSQRRRRRWFCVATIDEAIELREVGITDPILILGVVNVCDIALLTTYDLSFPVASMDWLIEAGAYLEENPLNKPLKVHIKVDTGMGRIGF